MGLARAINTKPVSVLGFINAFHTFVYGLGYSFAASGFPGTVLYENVDGLMTPQHFGWLMLVLGALGMVAFVKQSEKLVTTASVTQLVLWLFASILYFQNGDYALGVGVGFTWFMISAYTGRAFSNREYTARANVKRWLDEVDVDDWLAKTPPL